MTSAEPTPNPADMAGTERADARAEACGRFADKADPVAAETERSVRVLAELRDVGASMIAAMNRVVAGTASAAEEKALAGVDFGLAYPRIAKAVRQAVALQQEIMLENGKRRTSRLGQHKAQTKRIVRGAVEDAVAADKTAPERGETEKRALKTRLDDLFSDYDDLGDLEDCTVGQLVGRICRVLGVKPDLTLWPDAAEPEAPAVAAKPRRPVPKSLSGPSAVGLMGKPPPAQIFAGVQGRGPP